MLNAGSDLVEVLRELEVTESTWNRWRNQYGGLKAKEARRLRELEAENARLKKLLADPGPSSAGRGPAAGSVRGFRASSVSRGGPVPVDAAASQGRARRRRLRTRLRALAGEHPRWGWRKAHDVARREGLVVNPKRTRALWRDEGLQRPAPRRCKRRRLGDGTAARLRAEHPNHVWAVDFQFDETARHRRLKLLNIVDEFTREALAMHVDHAIGVDAVVDVVARLVAQRGAPEHLRMDNGPELVAWALRDWCRLWGTRTTYIEPGSPWQTPFVESFNGRVRDELLNLEDFADLREARVVIEDWRIEYNTYRPHRALNGLTPAEFARQWTQQHPAHP